MEILNVVIYFHVFFLSKRKIKVYLDIWIILHILWHMNMAVIQNNCIYQSTVVSPSDTIITVLQYSQMHEMAPFQCLTAFVPPVRFFLPPAPALITAP